MKVEPASSADQQSPCDDDLFHDMIPVFQKTKKVSGYQLAYELASLLSNVLICSCIILSSLKDQVKGEN